LFYKSFSLSLSLSLSACIIGNEILSGKIIDTNTPYLARHLFAYGVDLIRIVVCRDIREEISEQVKILSELVGDDGFVFTSGGIGYVSTHLHVLKSTVLMK
jgi:molybdopterin-biosynthesis enzyme MoeA-like protein